MGAEIIRRISAETRRRGFADCPISEFRIVGHCCGTESMIGGPIQSRKGKRMATAPRLIHYEDDLLRKQNARWQLISLIACGGLCLALVALLVVVHQPRTRPYGDGGCQGRAARHGAAARG